MARAVLGEHNYRRALRVLNDRRQKPRIGKVRFGDLRRVEPICRGYGYDRGRPVDRYYVENFLAAHGHLITGSVLEIGERTYTETFGQGVIRSDMLHVADEVGATYVADLTHAPNVPSNTYDCIILTQTLQMIFDMKSAIQTIYRILKPGGVLLCTAPGISQVADPVWNSTWYWSLTELSANRLFNCVFPPGGVDARAYGNVLSATSFLHGMSERELTRQELDVIDPEYPVIVTIKARKSDVGQRQPTVASAPFSPGRDDEPSRRLATTFLAGAGDTVEDWGSLAADLQDYISDVDGVLLHHVLEHSWGWRRILANAVSSFRHRLVLVVSTPVGDSEMRLDNEQPIPALQLPIHEIRNAFNGMTVREEIITAESGIGTETVFYVER